MKSTVRQKISKLQSFVLAGLVGFGLADASAQQTDTQPSPTSLSETYDAWTVQCATAGQGDQQRRQCQMAQELLQQDTRQRMLLIAITKEAALTKATLVLPFGLQLSEGIRIQIGQQEFARGPFRTCFPAGCVVEIELPDQAISELQGGESASVLMTATNGQTVKTDFSLKGFSAAFKRLGSLAGG